MKRSLCSIAVLALALSASPAFAADYGTAGCGIGAMAFKDQPGKIQIIAATLNNLISPQTFAITSGTSNCTNNPQTASTMFIMVNKQALRTDISRGGGESLAGLSKILKCSDSAELGSSLQKDYGKIFPNTAVTPEQINQSIHEAIQSDRELSQQCSAV